MEKSSSECLFDGLLIISVTCSLKILKVSDGDLWIESKAACQRHGGRRMNGQMEIDVGDDAFGSCS